jgi:hypothetical protein
MPDILPVRLQNKLRRSKSVLREQEGFRKEELSEILTESAVFPDGTF